MASTGILAEELKTPYEIKGLLSQDTPAWKFIASDPKDGHAFNPAEGFYPDKGGKLEGPIIKIEPDCFYKFSFTMVSTVRSHWGVTWYDKEGKARIADNYGVFQAVGKQRCERLIYSEAVATGAQPFFQSNGQIYVKDFKLEKLTDDEAAQLADELIDGLPKLKFDPPKDILAKIPKTIEAMKTGKEWRVVMLGDSIINDTYNSAYPALLKRHFPKMNWKLFCSVRGSTGCWFYKDPEQFKLFVSDYKPDLLIVGGISQLYDLDSLRELIEKVKKEIGCEILLMTGPMADDWRKIDYYAIFDGIAVPQPWEFKNDAFYKYYAPYAKTQELAFIDMHSIWNQYLGNSKAAWQYFHRDKVHANELGKQILARIIEQCFKTAK